MQKKCLSSSLRWVALGLISLLMLTQARADAGHEQGENTARETSATQPRFHALSEEFELVGIINGRDITLYLDRYADGSPAENTVLSLSLNNVSIPVEARHEGEFHATLAQDLLPGEITISAIVTDREKTSRLSGEFDIHAPSAESDNQTGWSGYITGASMVLAIVILGAGIIQRASAMRRTRFSRKISTGGAA